MSKLLVAKNAPPIRSLRPSRALWADQLPRVDTTSAIRLGVSGDVEPGLVLADLEWFASCINLHDQVFKECLPIFYDSQLSFYLTDTVSALICSLGPG